MCMDSHLWSIQVCSYTKEWNPEIFYLPVFESLFYPFIKGTACNIDIKALNNWWTITYALAVMYEVCPFNTHTYQWDQNKSQFGSYHCVIKSDHLKTINITKHLLSFEEKSMSLYTVYACHKNRKCLPFPWNQSEINIFLFCSNIIIIWSKLVTKSSVPVYLTLYLRTWKPLDKSDLISSLQ